jgi:hypothetical protein
MSLPRAAYALVFGPDKTLLFLHNAERNLYHLPAAAIETPERSWRAFGAYHPFATMMEGEDIDAVLVHLVTERIGLTVKSVHRFEFTQDGKETEVSPSIFILDPTSAQPPMVHRWVKLDEMPALMKPRCMMETRDVILSFAAFSVMQEAIGELPGISAEHPPDGALSVSTDNLKFCEESMHGRMWRRLDDG